MKPISLDDRLILGKLRSWKLPVFIFFWVPLPSSSELVAVISRRRLAVKVSSPPSEIVGIFFSDDGSVRLQPLLSLFTGAFPPLLSLARRHMASEL